MGSLVQFVRRKYREFVELDGETRFRYLWRNVRYLVEMVLGYLVLSALWVLYPVFRIRVGLLLHQRIGHLLVNTELYLRRQAERGSGAWGRRLFLSGKPANRQLLNMIKRRLCVIECPLVCKILQPLSHKGYRVLFELPLEGNEFVEFNRGSPQLAFTSQEIDQGQELLSRLGVAQDARYICFHNRDSKYLDSTLPQGRWKYHDYRDCAIDNYLPAAEYLADMGYYSIRTGHLVKDKLTVPRNSRVIDYASECRSDFGDVYLHAHCMFTLGCTSGLGGISMCFDVPVALANIVPLTEPPLGGDNALYIPMKLWDIEDRRYLTFREILDRGADTWHWSENYVNAGIQVVQNTPEEILAFTAEMHDRLAGCWVAADEDEELQARYQALFTPAVPRAYGCRARIGAQFLRQNRNLLD